MVFKVVGDGIAKDYSHCPAGKAEVNYPATGRGILREGFIKLYCIFAPLKM
jgi:hypothetical protein